MEAKEFKNAIGYICINTDVQDVDNRSVIEAQKKEILSYANQNGYNIVEWFCDEMSRACDDRPEFNKILYGEDITNPPFEAVIAFKSNKIARDTKLYFYYLYILEKRNIKLLSTQETFLDGNEFADIYRALMTFIAEQERKNITLHTGSRRKIKAAAGCYSGGKAPFGYKIKDSQLVIDETEAEIVREIFDHKDSMPYLRIAELLNSEGKHTRSGGQFYASGVKAIILNEPTYRGMYRYGRGKDKKDIPWVKGVHEPILKDTTDGR